MESDACRAEMESILRDGQFGNVTKFPRHINLELGILIGSSRADQLASHGISKISGYLNFPTILFLNRLRSLVFKIFNSFISSVAILCFVIDYRLVKLYTASFSWLSGSFILQMLRFLNGENWMVNMIKNISTTNSPYLDPIVEFIIPTVFSLHVDIIYKGVRLSLTYSWRTEFWLSFTWSFWVIFDHLMDHNSN